MTREPTGFQRAENRETYRQILIDCENAANTFASAPTTSDRQRAAVAHLLHSMIHTQRIMLNELDRQDPCMPDEMEIDFDTDLRMLFDAEDRKDNPGQLHP